MSISTAPTALDLLSIWLESGQLSRRKTAYLEALYMRFYDEASEDSEPELLDSCQCEMFGLDPGSWVIEGVAAVLDEIKPIQQGPTRWAQTFALLDDLGLL